MSEADILDRLGATLAARRDADPESSYVARLYHKGEDAILRKLGEEAVEVILAAKEGDDPHLVRELADLWFHAMVLMAHRGLSHHAVCNELARREGLSGLAEKAARGQDQTHRED